MMQGVVTSNREVLDKLSVRTGNELCPLREASQKLYLNIATSRDVTKRLEGEGFSSSILCETGGNVHFRI